MPVWLSIVLFTLVLFVRYKKYTVYKNIQICVCILYNLLKLYTILIEFNVFNFYYNQGLAYPPFSARLKTPRAPSVAPSNRYTVSRLNGSRGPSRQLARHQASSIVPNDRFFRRAWYTTRLKNPIGRPLGISEILGHS